MTDLELFLRQHHEMTRFIVTQHTDGLAFGPSEIHNSSTFCYIKAITLP